MLACRIAYAFKQYRVDSEAEIARWEYDYQRLSERHRAMLANLPAKFAAARNCACNNHLFILEMLSYTDLSVNPDAPPHLANANQAALDYGKTVTRTAPGDVDKVVVVHVHGLRIILVYWCSLVDGAAPLYLMEGTRLIAGTFISFAAAFPGTCQSF